MFVLASGYVMNLIKINCAIPVYRTRCCSTVADYTMG